MHVVVRGRDVLVIRAELSLHGHEHVHHTIVCPSYIGTGMFEGAEAPKATCILEPDYLAEKVVHAVERNTVHALEPFMVKLTPIIRALLPVGLYDKTSHLFGAVGKLGHQWAPPVAAMLMARIWV